MRDEKFFQPERGRAYKPMQGTAIIAGADVQAGYFGHTELL
jgi:hypothetical protein